MTRARFADVVVDPSGRPLPTASVEVFEAGTTTPISATIYNSPTGSGTLTNPFETNAQGEVEFWLAAPRKVDLRYSKNGYTAESHTVDVLDAEHTHSGTYVPINVTATGVAATDTAALQAAIDTAEGRLDREIRLAGNFTVNATLQIDGRGLHFVGEGHGRPSETGGTNINFTGTGALFQLGTDNGNAHDAADYDGLQTLRLSNLALHATGSYTALSNGQGLGYRAGTTAIKDWRGGDIRLKNVSIENFEYGFWGIQSDINHFEDLFLAYNKYGLYAGPRSDQLSVDTLYTLLNDTAVWLDRVAGARFTNCQFVWDGSASINPIKISSDWASAGTEGVVFDRCWFEHFGGVDEIEAFIDFGVGATSTCHDLVLQDSTVQTNVVGTPKHAKYLVKASNADRIYINRLLGPYAGNLVKPVFVASAPASPHIYLNAPAAYWPTTGGSPVRPFDATGGIEPIVFRQYTDATQIGEFAYNQDAARLIQRCSSTAETGMLQLDKRPQDGLSNKRWQFLLSHSTGDLRLSPLDSNNLVKITNLANNATALTVNTSTGTITPGSGTTANRPSAVTAGAGAQWFDTTLNRPLWSNGTAWLDAYGIAVDTGLMFPDPLDTGEETFQRDLVTSNSVATMTSQLLRLCYFTARKTETITQIKLYSGNTAAGATPTLVRAGVWTSDGTGALLSQVATTPNDTALLAGSLTDYSKSFSASFTKTAGQRYAVGLLVVTAATAPTIRSTNGNNSAGVTALSPRQCAQVSGQADLPSTLAAGSLTNTSARPFFVLAP